MATATTSFGASLAWHTIGEFTSLIAELSRRTALLEDSGIYGLATVAQILWESCTVWVSLASIEALAGGNRLAVLGRILGSAVNTIDPNIFRSSSLELALLEVAWLRLCSI